MRLVLTVLGEAERFGAVLANGCEATGLVERAGRAAGLLVRDTGSGREFELSAANVVNATGVWADRLRPDEIYGEEEVPRIRPSRGTHVILAREALDVRAGVIVPAGERRTAFALPWLGRTLIGTTDNDYEGELEHVPPSAADVEYLLAAVNGFFGTALSPSDLTGAYAGVRPLISTADAKKSVDISRRAELYETSSGLVTITGGKLTTWRRMAKMAVDRIVEREGREAPCRTHEIPLGQPVDAASLPKVQSVDEDSRAHLATRYGHAAQFVLRLAEAAPELGRRISPELPDILAEAPFAAAHEQARTLGDVLLRRTRLGLLDARALTAPGAAGPRAVARAMGAELGWDDARVARELDDWRALARAEGLVLAGACSHRSGRVILRLRERTLDLTEPVLMGILNATPDSFSDEQRPKQPGELAERGLALVEDGAAIVDLGGESGRTDTVAVTAEEEAARVVPLVERLAAAGVLVSVDTWRAPVARRVLAAGAAMINDVSGLADPELADACAEAGAALVITHTLTPPKTKAFPAYDDVVEEVARFLDERVELALAHGVGEERLVLDPGIDLAKTPAESVELLRSLPRLAERGLPLLLAVSRKDFVGALTGRPPAARDAGTLAALGAALRGGARILRVHDVPGARDYLSVHAALEGGADRSLELAEGLRREAI